MNLKQICEEKLKELGLHEEKRYIKRLKWESEEILAKNLEQYFIDLYSKKVRYPINENNLLVCWLLGIVPDFDIEKEPSCSFGESPDIDIDYIPQIRHYIKEVWAPKTFGEDYVCNIGNYTTFGLKSAFLDMARVHGESYEEIQALTKKLEAKDEEGKPLTIDAALKLYPEFSKYCDEHKNVAQAARKLLGRNRGMGVHAGGLIISRIPISDLVPLTKRKDSPQASAWVEGLHGQDLQPVGLVKFDLLVISNLLQIARCCELVKKRHNLQGICNRPGEPDWTDVPKWRNDPEALAMADAGDLKCIFQFDSEGIRGLVRAGGVSRFEDLVAYSALYRPGCLAMSMHERYVERKRGREKYDIHPLIRPILDKTYGIICYQEQIMRILNVVGEIPLTDCEIVRKAISKKKLESFIKYKEMFLLNGKKNLGYSDEEINNFYGQIEAFAEYGFNLSHACAYTYISMYLLYLKSHYPHEFYASVLSCESLSEKIKEYKMEAKLHGVEMHRLDINKSGINFELQGDVIYYGFSNVKGLGEGPAKRIVENQPYKSFEDFLLKFGTDASVLKPIIGLRCFRDRDPVTLWKFAGHFKDSYKKIEDKKKRFMSSMEKYEIEFREMLPNETRKLSDLEGDNPFDLGDWKSLYDIDEKIEGTKEVKCAEGEGEAKWVFEDISVGEEDQDEVYIERETLKYFKKVKYSKIYNRWKELRKLWQKRKKSIDNYIKRANDSLPKLSEFNPDDYEIDDALLKLFRDPVLCEEEYYGFSWVHELECSPDYRGMTFDILKSNLDGSPGPVEIKIKNVACVKSKKGNEYHQIVAEDVTGNENKINIWADDWERWEKEFKKGNLLRVRLQPPSGGFATYLLESNQVGKWRGQLRYRDKDDDPRVCSMRPGKKEDEKFLTDDEALEQFSNCIME
jgi:DNA polymerase III alpha subunit